MADPLSIIASVIGIGGAAVSASKGLFELVDSIKNGPEQISTISKDLHSFHSIVSSLHSALQDDDVKRVLQEDVALTGMVGDLEKPLNNCFNILAMLMVKIQEHVKEDGKGFRMSSMDIKWFYFTRKEVKDLMDRLETSKTTLDTALASVGTLCNFRLMAANVKAGRPIRRGSTDTDAGYALRRYMEETTSYSGSIAPSPPRLFDAGFDANTWLGESPTLIPSDSIPVRRTPTPELTNPLERLRIAERQRNALHDVARNGDDLVLQRLLAEGADVNVKAADGKTALHLAAEFGNESVARILLDHNADVNVKSGAQGSPVERKFMGGRTPLHWAAAHGHEGVIQILLDYKADMAATNVSQRTALQDAISEGHDGSAKRLIENGAPIMCQDNEGWTPLHQAASKNSLEIEKILLEKGVEIEATTSDSNIWNNPWFRSATPLLLAAGDGHTASVEYLMAKGANIRARNGIGEMVVHLAAWRGFSDIVRIMLDAGIDIETRDSVFNETPLLKAASTGKTVVILLLLERGADIRAKTQVGRDALKHAELHQRGNDEAIWALKDYISKQKT